VATGIRQRHARSCGHPGAACSCRPTWEASVYLAREDRKIRKTFPTLAAAKAWRADAASAASRGKLRAPSPMTLRQAGDEYIAAMVDGVVVRRDGERYKPSTIRSYRAPLEARIYPLLGHRKLVSIERGDLQALADDLTASGLSASSVHGVMDPLRAIFRRAVQRDVVAVNPTKDLELRRPTGARERIADRDEAVALLAALPDRVRPIYATAMYAGLRRGELMALTWEHVDLAGRRISVERSWDEPESVFVPPKSKAGRRKVPILDALARELAAHKLRTGRGAGDLVFGPHTDRPFNGSVVYRSAHRAWKRTNKRAAEAAPNGVEPVVLEPIGLHEARHTFASLMIAANVNAKAISTCMGHSSITITFDLYGHLMPGALDEVADLTDRYLAASVGA